MRRKLIFLNLCLIATIAVFLGREYKETRDKAIAARKVVLQSRINQLKALNEVVDPAYQSPHFDGRNVFSRTAHREIINPDIEYTVLRSAQSTAAELCGAGHIARLVWIRDAKKVHLNGEPESEYDRSLVAQWRESMQRYDPIVKHYNAYVMAWQAEPGQTEQFPASLEEEFLECSGQYKND